MTTLTSRKGALHFGPGLPTLLINDQLRVMDQSPEELAEPTVEEAPSTEADVEAIRALLEKDASVIASGDLDGWIDLFTDDLFSIIGH